MKFMGMVLGGLLLASCSGNNDGMQDDEGRAPVVTTRLVSFDGEGQAVEADTEVIDVQACLFQGGVMTKVYKGLPASGGAYSLKLDRNEGILYVLANTEGLVDLDALLEQGISESEWKQSVVGMKDNRATRFFSGALELQSQEGGAGTVLMKRGVARFDIKTNVAVNVKIKSLTLTEVAQSGYLFSQSGALSPSGVSREEVTVNFPEALERDTPAVLYVYEQANVGMKVKVEVELDGAAARTLEKDFSGDVERNHIYTVTVRKDDIDITVTPTYEDWEEGSDTELVPASN